MDFFDAVDWIVHLMTAGTQIWLSLIAVQVHPPTVLEHSFRLGAWVFSILIVCRHLLESFPIIESTLQTRWPIKKHGFSWDYRLILALTQAPLGCITNVFPDYYFVGFFVNGFVYLIFLKLRLKDYARTM